ncbi:MAG: family 16 glycoside hydrolase [Planctomycetaceae bacterium]
MTGRRRYAAALLWGLIAMAGDAPEAAEQANYDEGAVRPYTLPDVLAGPDGRPATNPEEWRTRSRPHQFALLEQHVYGRRLPAVPVSVAGDVARAEAALADGTKATRLQARLRLGDAPNASTTDVLLYLPQAEQPVPVFLHLNFKGNQAEHPDPGIRLCAAWLPDDPKNGIVDHQATEASRAAHSRRWPVEQLLGRGYGVATACYGDVFPDRADGRAASVLAALGRPVEGDLPPDEPGAIGTWAWQLSRILDWLVTLPEVDATKVIVVGHSRNGKAAVWAGACDERFAMVISNESGCGGAALERRNYGETVEAITRRFPHWFCPAFRTYADRETDLPVDAHVTLAMAAPRPLYVASAVDDRWADPRGEFLAAVAAEPVWALFGLEGLGTADWPPVDTPIGKTIGYHVRSGKHDLLEEDWLRFADLADRRLRAAAPAPRAGADAAFRPVQEPLPVPPPAHAIVLFGDGTEPGGPQFTNMAGGPLDWQVEDGTLVMRTSKGHANHAVSIPVFRDADIHAEFVTTPRAQGNSGLYIHGHYEMQIFDSFGVEPPTDQDEGALYRFGKPLVNAARPAGEWQVYDVRFIAPRRGPDGRITKPGRITAWLNGRLVQDGIEFTEPRSPYVPYRHGVTDHLRAIEKRLKATGEGPLFLQDHGSPVRYRNVWIRPLDAS